MLVTTKFLTAKLHSLYVKESESESLERSEFESELDILTPTPQPWREHRWEFADLSNFARRIRSAWRQLALLMNECLESMVMS